MASVRVEGFPSPGAETKMKAMVKEESEKTLADLSEDERQDREIAFGATQPLLQELVGDVQLAVEEEPKEALHVKDMPAKENQTSVEREKHELTGLVVYRRRCRQCENAADYGCRRRKSSEEETAVPAVCCDSGFLKEKYQLHSTTMLVVAGTRYLAIEVRLLSTVVEAVQHLVHD